MITTMNIKKEQRLKIQRKKTGNNNNRNERKKQEKKRIKNNVIIRKLSLLSLLEIINIGEYHKEMKH